MKFHNVAATLALTAFVSVSGAAYASPAASLHSNVHAFFGNPHRISLTLENDGSQPLTLKAGTQEWTLQPGKDAKVKVNDGDKIVAETASAGHAAGALIAQATDDLNGATLRIK